MSFHIMAMRCSGLCKSLTTVYFGAVTRALMEDILVARDMTNFSDELVLSGQNADTSYAAHTRFYASAGAVVNKVGGDNSINLLCTPVFGHHHIILATISDLGHPHARPANDCFAPYEEVLSELEHVLLEVVSLVFASIESSVAPDNYETDIENLELHVWRMAVARTVLVEKFERLVWKVLPDKSLVLELRYSACHSFPIETWREIMTVLASAYSPVLPDIRQARGSLCLVNKYLRAVVAGTRDFYRTLCISPTSSSSSVKSFLTTSRPNRIAVHITDRPIRLRKYCMWLPTLTHFARLALRAANRWEALAIDVIEIDTYKAVVALVPSAVFPALRSFEGACVEKPYASTLPRNPRLAAANNLRELSVANIATQDLLVFAFPRLQSLTVADVPWTGWISGWNLVKFTRTWAGISTSGLPGQQCELPSLLEFSVSFNDERGRNSVASVCEFLELVTMPNLRTLRLAFGSEQELTYYTTYHTLLPAPNVILSCSFPCISAVSLLLASLRNTTTLDITEWDGDDIYKCLGDRKDVEGKTELILPRLTKLMVAPRSWNALYLGLSDRSVRGGVLASVEVVDAGQLVSTRAVDIGDAGDYDGVRSIISGNVTWTTSPVYV
ncbi:hypothetical protein R3P38DRAFT_2758864 [Favolaschia claudopus]|uniref:Uncharacterized protein n=1 Tax=Favolaschia claudopus TaxID=2862362 RepID=A0AAW0E5V3_9AGAR